MPPDRSAGLPSDQYDDFNYLLAQIGVNPISAADLSSAGEQIVTVGIPSAPLGTGWAYWRLPETFPANNPFPQQGWLMLDGSVSKSGPELQVPAAAPAAGHGRTRTTPRRTPWTSAACS